jgi:transcription elongation factor GreA
LPGAGTRLLTAFSGALSMRHSSLIIIRCIFALPIGENGWPVCQPFSFFFTDPPATRAVLQFLMATINYYTPEGLQKLKDELQDLKVRGRAKAAEDLREARDKGDLSENAEYDAAKDAQGLLELKISKLEEVLGNARVIDETNMDFSKVLIMSKVKLKNLKNNMVLNYVLVAEEEANLAAGKISVKSPIGKGLLGKSAGDMAEITVPAGKLQFEILEVGR